MLIGAIEHFWGTGTSLVQAPPALRGTVEIFGNQFPLYRLVAAGISLALSAGSVRVHSVHAHRTAHTRHHR